MAPPGLTIRVRLAWWLKPVMYAHAIAQGLRGKRVDSEIFGRMVARAARITVR